MSIMGISGVAAGPDTSKSRPEHKIYPYLLRNVSIARINQVWSTDITYIPMTKDFMYLTAVID
jgi:putative transposase